MNKRGSSSGTACVPVIEGEDLIRARQNRNVNSTFLIPGKTETVLPVSCVERGRWRYQGNSFQSGGHIMDRMFSGKGKNN